LAHEAIGTAEGAQAHGIGRRTGRQRPRNHPATKVIIDGKSRLFSNATAASCQRSSVARGFGQQTAKLASVEAANAVLNNSGNSPRNSRPA
jgi:hypothetical protein